MARPVAQIAAAPARSEVDRAFAFGDDRAHPDPSTRTRAPRTVTTPSSHLRLGIRLVQLTQVAEDVGRLRPAGAASTCLGRSMPVSTRADAMPARFAPRMSVSSRSPRKSGCRAPKRATASSKIGTSGLPATVASRPTAVCTAETSVPLPGATAPRLRDRPVGVGRDPRDAALLLGNGEGKRGLGELRPADLGCETLHDGSRGIVGAARDREAVLLELMHETVAADHEHGRARRDALARAGASPACGLVTTSAGAVARPSSVRCAATDASVREALLVM